MIKSLTINNFRGFEHFELHDLGRVNLIVGTNNSGKTSVLEALELVSAQGNASVVSKLLQRRSEEVEDPCDPRGFRRYVDLRRLIHGHKVNVGGGFKVSSFDPQQRELSFVAKIVVGEDNGRFEEDPEGVAEYEATNRSFFLGWYPSRVEVEARIVFNGAVSVDTLRNVRTRRGVQHVDLNVRFVSALSLSPDEAVESFSSLQLRPQEQFIYDALRIIEPKIQRLGIQVERFRGRGLSGLRGGFSVLLSDSPEPVPIGSMGEGIWRMLGLAICLAQAENGILLVDEIDTGLHYSVMQKMWKMVFETAKRLNVQVFATSHSRDCYESLAAVCRESVSNNSEVTIQRIERGKKKSIAYTEQEIVIAAEHGSEVR